MAKNPNPGFFVFCASGEGEGGGEGGGRVHLSCGDIDGIIKNSNQGFGGGGEGWGTGRAGRGLQCRGTWQGEGRAGESKQ